MDNLMLYLMDENEYKKQKKIKNLLRAIALIFCFIIVLSQALSLKVCYQAPMDGLFGSSIDAGFKIEKIVFADLKKTLNPGDIILAVNGYPVWSQDSDDKRWFGGIEVFPLDGLSPGDEYTYTIQSGTEIFDTTVTLQRLDLSQFFKTHSILVFVAFVYLTLGLFTVLKRPDRKVAWIMFLLFAIGTFDLLGPATYLTMLGSSLAAVISAIHWEILYPLTAALLFHFAVEFPSTNYTRKSKYLLLTMIYGQWILLSLAVVKAWLTDHAVARETMDTIAIGAPSVVGLLAILVMIRTFRMTKDVIKKTQIRWVLWSFTIIAIPSLTIYQIGWLFGNDTILSWDMIVAGSLIIPVSLTISMAKYKLFAINQIINRSMVYGIVTAVSTTIFIICSLALSLLLNSTIDASLPSLSTIISTIIVIVLFNPLKNRSQVLVDKFFYKKKIIPQSFLKDIGKQLATSTDFDKICELMTKQIPQKMGIKKAWLFISDPVNQTFTSIDKQEQANHRPILSLILDYQKNFPVSASMQYIDPEQAKTAEQSLREHDIQIIIPIKKGNDFIGQYILAAKESDMPYTTSELNVIETLSYQLAVALTNATAFAALEQEKQRIEYIIRSISEGVVILDNRGTITKINQAILDLLNKKEEEILKQHYSKVFIIRNKDKQLSQIDPVKQSLEQTKAYQGLHWLQTGPDYESLIPISLYLDPLFNQIDKYQGMVMTVYDRSEEEQLLSIKDSFIATVGHELRTPLSIAKFTLELIGDQPFASEQQQKDFETIRNAVERLTKRVQQIMDISSIQSGSAQISIQKLDPAELMEMIEEEYALKAKAKKLEFVISYPKTKLPHVAADPKWLKKILSLLVSNAIDFTDEGSVEIQLSLSIANEQIKIPSGSHSAKYLIIEVKDTGCGIDKSTQKHLFESFFQKGGALGRDENKGGLGLGLHLAKTLIEKQKGRIWYKTVYAKGTSFFVSIPLADTSPKPDQNL